MSDVPSWVAALPPGRACGTRRLAWLEWETEIAAYCASFQSPYPKRNSQEWRAMWHVEYGKTPLSSDDLDGTSTGEFELVSAFRAAGWQASWTDAFGSAPAWMAEWKRPRAPERILALSAAVAKLIPGARPWDVVAWHDDDFRFVEFKQPSEKPTHAERKFIWGAIQLGVRPDAFAVLVGTVTFPPRQPQGNNQ